MRMRFEIYPAANQFVLLSYLLGELVLDDAHNSAGRLNIDALRLELGKGIHSDVLNLDGKNITTIGQLSQLALVIELALEDVLPTNNEGGRRVGTRRVQEGHGKVEPRCLERHHSTELSSSDASHAKGGRIGGNVATGHVGVEPSGVAMITVRVYFVGVVRWRIFVIWTAENER